MRHRGSDHAPLPPLVAHRVDRGRHLGPPRPGTPSVATHPGTTASRRQCAAAGMTARSADLAFGARRTRFGTRKQGVAGHPPRQPHDAPRRDAPGPARPDHRQLKRAADEPRPARPGRLQIHSGPWGFPRVKPPEVRTRTGSRSRSGGRSSPGRPGSAGRQRPARRPCPPGSAKGSPAGPR